MDMDLRIPRCVDFTDVLLEDVLWDIRLQTGIIFQAHRTIRTRRAAAIYKPRPIILWRAGCVRVRLS